MQSSLDGLDHLIPRPRELYAASGVGGLLELRDDRRRWRFTDHQAARAADVAGAIINKRLKAVGKPEKA